MVAVASPTPTRLTAGLSTDFPYGPLANMGMPNPFFYHMTSDDFDQEIAESGYTKTTSGNGTIALTPGDGGRALFTTNSSTPAAGDVASLQLPAAGFTFTALKKSFFLCRVQLSDVINAGLLTGLIQTTATPFTVTDGLYFLKASGSATNLILRSTIGSVNTDLVIPVAAYALANNVDIDLAWFVDRNQTAYAFVGGQLVGYIPQSGIGATTPARGPAASFAPVLTAAVLNQTIALQSGTATSKTANADFIMTSKER